MAGFEPATSSLPRKCSTPELHRHVSWSGRRGSNSRPSAWKADALSTELLPHCRLWAKMDSNHRRYKPADLQSAPFGHSGIRPYFFLSSFRPLPENAGASCRIRTNDPEITNHVLWPTELKRRVLLLFCLAFRRVAALKAIAKLRTFSISANIWNIFLLPAPIFLRISALFTQIHT